MRCWQHWYKGTKERKGEGKMTSVIKSCSATPVVTARASSCRPCRRGTIDEYSLLTIKGKNNGLLLQEYLNARLI
jgi:hypothetical protein